MASHETLLLTLELAGGLLDRAAGEIRDIPLQPTKEHITRIGQILGEIFEIQQQIYAIRPDLTPSYLIEESPNPQANRRLTEAMGKALLREDAGDKEEAIGILKQYLAIEVSKVHRDIVLGEINRLHEGMGDFT